MLNNVRLLLLGLWLGAAIFFSGAVAPGAFKVLRAFNLPNATEIAGTIVSRTLAIINTSGFIISVLLLISALLLRKLWPRYSFILQIALLSIVAAATGIGEWMIAAQMRVLRAGFNGPIDQVPATDAGRIAFDALHGYSVTALSLGVLAGLVAFFVMSKRLKLKQE